MIGIMVGEDKANHIPEPGQDWSFRLARVLKDPEVQGIWQKLDEDRGKIYPEKGAIFRAFELTAFADTRVVILGQDPYHGPGQAHGLCFSVPAGQKHPPSLRNIFKELQRDLGTPPPPSGDLSHWARQGVLLLNTVLTVRENEPGSHEKIGWDRFTDAVISELSRNGHTGLIFLLWGTHAQKKLSLIDQERHHVLTAPHPSPLSAHRGFIGCGHFRRVNELLTAQGGKPIDWSLS